MQTTIIGGGPGGLYLSILLKKARPDDTVTVIERGRPRDTYGFGVVFSDASTRLEASRLLTYKAAWRKGQGAERVSVESAQAKLFATETAQALADLAVQVHGGRGVLRGHVVERLYRDVRSLRIYEGTSEMLRDVVGRALLADE